jgi:hypothetical protein
MDRIFDSVAAESTGDLVWNDNAFHDIASIRSICDHRFTDFASVLHDLMFSSWTLDGLNSRRYGNVYVNAFLEWTLSLMVHGSSWCQ